MKDIERKRISENNYEVPYEEQLQSEPFDDLDNSEAVDPKLLLKKKNEDLGFAVFCLNCGGDYEHILIARHKESEKTEIHEVFDLKGKPKRVSKKFQFLSEFVRCRNCGFASIRRSKFDFYEKRLVDEGVFIPKRINRKAIENPKGKIGLLINREIYDLYEESIEAYNSHLNFSAGAAIRSTLETICKEIGIRSSLETKELMRFAAKEDIDIKNIGPEKTKEIKRSIRLEDQVRELIKKMRNKGISEEHLSVLQEIRDWGNNNIHHNQVPDSDDLNDALTIIEKVIKVLFFDPIEQEKFANSITNFRNRR